MLGFLLRSDSHIDYSNMIVPDYKELDLSELTFSRDDFKFWGISPRWELCMNSYDKIRYALGKVYERAWIGKKNAQWDGYSVDYFIDIETWNVLKPINKEQDYILRTSHYIYEYQGFVQTKIWYVNHIIDAIKEWLQNSEYYSILSLMDDATIDIVKFRYLYNVSN